MTLAPFAFELIEPGDPPLDFCLWRYAPPCKPVADAIRGVNLLYMAAMVAGGDATCRELVASLRGALGPFRTVWGVKWHDGSVSAEFYFYDYERTARALPFSRIAQAFAPVADVQVTVDEALPYFMASIEVPLAASGGRAAVLAADIYVGNPDDRGISSGMCHEVGPGGTRLKNLYYFFDAQNDWGSFLAKAACSAHVPMGSVSPDDVFPEWLREARVAVVANKQLSDGAYFSGIGIDALVRFMETFAYPPALVVYACENRDRLAHLMFDVGYDYRVENGRVIFGKSSIYNVL